MKVVRELGLERCETVRFLSAMTHENCDAIGLVREDRSIDTNGSLLYFFVQVVMLSIAGLNNC
jgi:hypothetical protein